MHVLFVTENRFDRLPSGDGSTRYRCFNVAEALLTAGHRATVASMAELSLDTLKRYDVVSVLRPRAGRRLQQLLQAARQAGCHLVADFDDLIFDVSIAAQSPLVLNGFADVETVSRGFARFAQAAQCFDEITVSTEPLAAAAQRCFSDHSIYVLSNGLSPLWLHHADQQQSPEVCNDGKMLSYLPGTRSHDADFRTVQSAVARWLAVDTERTLKIVGELAFDKSIVSPLQVVESPLVPYFKLPEIIRSSGITLAPLVDNRFNDAKSHIKFLESAAFGVPIVATANADMIRHIGVPGLVCAGSTHPWFDAIEQATQVGQDRQACLELSDYVRNEWVSTVTSRSAIKRWQQLVGSRIAPAAAPQKVNHPESFFLSLRPVPRIYSRRGWKAHQTTYLIVADRSDAAFPEDELIEAIGQLTAIDTLDDEQWVVLVPVGATAEQMGNWQQLVRRCCPDAKHIEVLWAKTHADRCSIIFQSEHLLNLSAVDITQIGGSTRRSQTSGEIMHVSIDRWQRKARKFRESPQRFFSDSRFARVVGR